MRNFATATAGVCRALPVVAEIAAGRLAALASRRSYYLFAGDLAKIIVDIRGRHRPALAVRASIYWNRCCPGGELPDLQTLEEVGLPPAWFLNASSESPCDG
jgi:hypothetical protein